MNKLTSCLIIAATAGCLQAQDQPTDREWKATLNVVDETGQPVRGAQVSILYDLPERIGKNPASAKITGLTDTNGMFIAAHRDSTHGFGFRIEKAGYYQTWINHDLGFSFDYDPVKWHVETNLILKRVIQPIPMYARWVHEDPPATNQPVGFDLMAGDWVHPYGNGRSTDIIFTKDYNQKSRNDFEHRLTIGFPNSGDGIQGFVVPYPFDQGSDLRSPHEALPTGYHNQLLRETLRHPGQPSKSDYDENKNYFIRVRTVLDAKGNIKSALYGKIYGDFMNFRYYLNPEPNSRNVEFDPKQNLLKGLDPIAGGNLAP